MRQIMLILVVTLVTGIVRAENVAVAAVDTTLVDGLVVSGSVNLVYSPIDTGSVSLEVNGREVLAATEPGTFAWSPERPGTYVLTHRAGANVFTRNVLYSGTDGSKEMEIGWLENPVSHYFPNVYASVTNVVIATTVTTLSEDAFSGCTALSSITIPESVKRIGANAFAGCTALMMVDVASLADWLAIRFKNAAANPLHTGASLYVGGEEVTNLVIPSGATEIGSYAFQGGRITSVTIPDSVTNVAATAFAGCTNVVSVTVGEGLIPEKRLIAEVSGETEWAVEAELLDGEPIYKSNTIDHNGSTAVEFVVPVGMKQLCFSWKVSSESNCDWLTWYLDGVQKDRISGDRDWQPVEVPLDVGEHRVKFVYSKDGSVNRSLDCGWVSIESVAGSVTMAGVFPDAYGGIRELTMPTGANYPNDHFLNGCTSLVSVTLPSQLAGAAVAQSRATLESVVLTDVPEKIGDGMFADCVRLTTFVVPDGTVEIGEEAFAGCTALTSITIPESVMRIGANAFAGCTALTSLTLPTGLVDFSLDIIPEHLRASMGLAYDDDGFMIYNGWLLDYADKTVSELVVPDGVIGIGRLALANMEDLETVDLPSTLKYIGENAFQLDTYLDNVVIPDSVEVIGRGAFESCTWITTLTIGSGVKTVEDGAFSGCSSLYRAIFADGLESVGEDAFDGCVNLMSVSLPISLTHLASSAFTGCKSLIGVTTPTGVAPMSDWFAPVYKQIKNVTIPSGETLVCSNMFKDCAAMESIVLPEGVTNIAAGAFWNCTKLPSVVLPSSLVTVGESAFQDCDGLTAVGLPEAVADIGAYAFYDCGNLADLSLGKALRAIPSYAFANCPKLDSFVVPATVTNLGSRFCGSSVRSIYYLGSAPAYVDDAYASTSGSLVSYVKSGTKGWDGIPSSRYLPERWPVNNGYSRTLTTWSPVQYDVTFDAGEGLFAPVAASHYACEQIKGTAYSLPPFNPTRKGYKFGGWWTESSGGAQVTPSTGVKLDKAHTLYAHWIETLVVKVRFNACGGTVDPEEAEYTAEVPFGSFPVPTREHYVFVGWYTTPSGGTRMRESAEVPRADREVFAQWTPAHYLIRFNANNGSGASASQDYIYGQTVTLKGNMFSCAGCQFAGWSLTPGGAAVYSDGKTISELAAIEDGVMNLYAVWTGNVYAVRFDSHGGYGVMPNQTFVIGVAMPLSPCAFTRQGYVFTGWAESTTAEVAYGDGQTVCDLTHQQAGTVVLYAVWERDATQEWMIEEYLNCTNLTFTLGGNEPHWYGLKTSRADKQGMMRSGAIGNSQTNWIETVVSGPGTVSFWWKASGEYEVNKKGVVTMYDYAEFTVDGESVAEIGAESEWEPVELTVDGPGPHTLRWMYHKDEGGSDGEDCAWVSEIVWTPSAAPVEILPDLGGTPTAADVTNAVAGATDPLVKAKIDAANYNDFRDWAGKVKTAGGSDAGAQGVMEAQNAWISYALGQGTLLSVAPTDADLSVETFEPTAEAGKFDFTVSVKDVEVGSEAAAENLKKVFGLEGAATLDNAAFSSDKVDVEFGTPEGGKVKFTAGPKEASAGTFFMKVKMLP